jgi:hypothetical protein
MAQTIKIKRSTTTAVPSSLTAGELAYSDNSDKLFIGAPADSAVVAIGGKVYVDMLDHTAGTLTASSAIVVDANSKIDKLLTGNIRINNAANQIDTTSGGLILDPTGDLIVKTGTIDLSNQATEFKLLDNSATAGTFATADHTYITFDTTNSAELIKIGRQLEINGAYTLPMSAGTSGQALVTDGSGTVTFQDVAATLTVDSDSATADVALLTDDLRIIGGEGLNTVVAKSGTDVTLTIRGEDATNATTSGAANKGIASFDSVNFAVTSGFVESKPITLTADDSNTLDKAAGEGLTVEGGIGIASKISSGKLVLDGTNATSSSRGVASFDSTDFTVSSGAVSANAITLGSSSLNLGETTTAIAGLTQLDVDNIRIDGNTIRSTNTNGNISLNPNGSGVVDVNNSRISSVADPTQAQDAATKAYVDAVKQALDIKDSVRVATTAAITIASDLGVGDAIDGVTLADGDRVLVKNQTDASQNGIYLAGSSPVRSADANASLEVTSGMFCFVEEGTVNGDNGFVLTTNDPITLDTTDLTFTQFNGAGQIIAGDALSKSGNTLNVNDDNITLEVASDNLRIKGITTTAVGDLLIGAATNGGYTRLVKPSGNATAHDYILSMNTSGAAQWSNTLDGGSF